MNQQIKHLRLLVVLALFIGALLPASSANAQMPQRDQNYLRDAIELAGVLGSAHAIRVACNGRDDQYWRAHMRDMLGLEAPDRGALRRSMVAAFNDNYQRVSARYTQCDNNAVQAEALYASEGRALADALAAHYFKGDAARLQERYEDFGDNAVVEVP